MVQVKLWRDRSEFGVWKDVVWAEAEEEKRKEPNRDSGDWQWFRLQDAERASGRWGGKRKAQPWNGLIQSLTN